MPDQRIVNAAWRVSPAQDDNLRTEQKFEKSLKKLLTNYKIYAILSM